MSQNNLSIEEKIKKLEADTAWFDSEEFSIDQALSRYEKLAELGKEIEQDLAALENKITDINKD